MTKTMYIGALEQHTENFMEEEAEMNSNRLNWLIAVLEKQNHEKVE